MSIVENYTRLRLLDEYDVKVGLHKRYMVIRKDGIRQISKEETGSILEVIKELFDYAFTDKYEAQDILLIEGEKPEIKVKGRWLLLEQCRKWDIDHFNYFLFNMSNLVVGDRDGYYYLGEEEVHLETDKEVRSKFKYTEDRVDIRSRDMERKLGNSFLDKRFYAELMRSYEGSYDYSLNMGNKILRCHIYSVFGDSRRRERAGLTIRVVPQEIPKLNELNLPRKIENVTRHRGGLFLVSGRAGDGKSTTVASIVNKFNRDPSSREVITIVEDPIEYVHRPVNARIIQRRLGDNVPSYSRAMSDSLRESTDIVVLGELREQDEIVNALRLAEVGKLVIATIHANSVADTVDRFIGEFSDARVQYRSRLLENLLGILHQNLIVYSGEQFPLSSMLILENEEARAVLREKDFTRASISDVISKGDKDWAISQEDWFLEQVKEAEEIAYRVETGEVRWEDLPDYQSKLRYLLQDDARRVLLGEYGINEEVDRITITGD